MRDALPPGDPRQSGIRGWAARVIADAGGFALLLTAAVCVGLLLNRFRDHPLPLVYVSKAVRVENAVSEIQAQPEGISVSSAGGASLKSAEPQPISLDEFRRYAEKKEGLILDARPEIFYQLGHVPGALSLPREDFKSGYAKLLPHLENDRKQFLLVYCSDADCEDSQMVADALAKLGYQRVFIFKGGWDEWQAAQLPEAKAE